MDAPLMLAYISKCWWRYGWYRRYISRDPWYRLVHTLPYLPQDLLMSCLPTVGRGAPRGCTRWRGIIINPTVFQVQIPEVFASSQGRKCDLCDFRYLILRD